MSLVDIIMVTHNSRAVLPTCLESLANQTETPHQTIVVDNASEDETVDWLRRVAPAVSLITNKTNCGFAAAVNQGATASSADYLLLLNPDTQLAAGALAKLVEFLANQPNTAAVSPLHTADAAGRWRQSGVPYPPQWRWLSWRLPGLRRLRLGQEALASAWALNRAIWRGRDPVAVPYLSGACLLLRRDAFAASGGLDTGYFLFFEDNELSCALRAAGYELQVLPTARVWHQIGHSTQRESAAVQAHLVASGRRYLRRHSDWLSRTLWWLLEEIPRPSRPAGPPAPTSLDQPNTQGTNRWLEVARDRTFLHAWATEVTDAAGAHPAQWPVPNGQTLFWRTAPIAANGTVGAYDPVNQCTL